VVNLILAGCWLIAAIVLYFVEPEQAPNRPIPITWFGACCILAGYNLFRFVVVRMARSGKSQGEQFLPRRRLHHPGDDVIEPDPNFMFTDQPPVGPAPPHPAPPGANGIRPETK
jgi:hypothetical protein